MASTSSTKPPVPPQYAGMWIAWNQAQTAIIASASTFKEVFQAAVKLGEEDPVFEKVPRSDAPFLGGVRW